MEFQSDVCALDISHFRKFFNSLSQVCIWKVTTGLSGPFGYRDIT